MAWLVDVVPGAFWRQLLAWPADRPAELLSSELALESRRSVSRQGFLPQARSLRLSFPLREPRRPKDLESRLVSTTLTLSRLLRHTPDRPSDDHRCKLIATLARTRATGGNYSLVSMVIRRVRYAPSRTRPPDGSSIADSIQKTLKVVRIAGHAREFMVSSSVEQ